MHEQEVVVSINSSRSQRSVNLGIVSILSLTLAGCSSAGAVLNGEVLLDSGLIEREIEGGVLNQSGFRVSAECPDPMSGKVGDVRECVIEDEFGTVAVVEVKIQNSEGFIVWEVR